MEHPQNNLAGRVKTAAGAAWWTLLIMAIVLTVAWVGAMLVTGLRPVCVAWILGGREVDWDQIYVMYLWFFGAMKMILWIVVIAAIWLSLWARKLRRL